MALTVKSTDDQAVLDAEHELWATTFSYIKSMALKSALDLRLADAIHHHGGAAEPLYALTPVSRLLVGSWNLVSIITMLLSPNFVTTFLGIGAWSIIEVYP
ncbi:hypothetical protein TRIUR3_14813 [Triticum urartu]|uniref:Uncharacterized protein n=1 Tax=Triticum urartu TaxID=4572 RepID=M7YRU6_TRIUA|nr:hypothetical protein TRIUR3_14813 [Triticum urartu]